MASMAGHFERVTLASTLSATNAQVTASRAESKSTQPQASRVKVRSNMYRRTLRFTAGSNVPGVGRTNGDRATSSAPDLPNLAPSRGSRQRVAGSTATSASTPTTAPRSSPKCASSATTSSLQARRCGCRRPHGAKAGWCGGRLAQQSWRTRRGY